MISAIIIYTIWFSLGIIGHKIDDDVLLNIPFLIFIVAIPFFPFIFTLCGL